MITVHSPTSKRFRQNPAGIIRPRAEPEQPEQVEPIWELDTKQADPTKCRPDIEPDTESSTEPDAEPDAEPVQGPIYHIVR
jgi:hypothetical protein